MDNICICYLSCNVKKNSKQLPDYLKKKGKKRAETNIVRFLMVTSRSVKYTLILLPFFTVAHMNRVPVEVYLGQ